MVLVPFLVTSRNVQGGHRGNHGRRTAGEGRAMMDMIFEWAEMLLAFVLWALWVAVLGGIMYLGLRLLVRWVQGGC